MDKCREAFEKLPVIEEIMGDDYVMFDEQFKKYLCGVGENEEYLNGAWMVWQSRQSEFDAMTEALLNQTQLLAKKQAEVDQLKNLLEKDEHAHNLYYENANLQTLVEEKDKRIEEALYALKGLKAENDLWGCDQVEVQIEILEKALRGEHG